MKIKDILAMIKRFIYKTFFSCYKKRKIRAYLIKEREMGLVYRVYLGELGASDVVSREVSFTVDGASSSVTVPANTAFVDMPPVNEGVVIAISVRDTDDAGNFSVWSEPYTFSTRDTLAPKMPGAVRLELIDEVANPAPSPAPDPEPTPTPDPEPPPPSDDSEEDTVLVDDPEN